MQGYAQTNHSEEDVNSFYNDVDEILGKANHQPVLVGDVNAYIEERTNPMVTAKGKVEVGLKNERSDTLVRKYKIMKEMDVEKPKRCNED